MTETATRFDQELQLPLPEMVFPENNLKLEHESGLVLEFLALDALRLVNSSEDPLKVAVAEEWCKQQYVCTYMHMHAYIDIENDLLFSNVTQEALCYA